MVRTTGSIRSHVKALAEREPAFARVIEQHGVPAPRNSERGVQTLLRTIVGQQVSVAAARAMWAKLEAAFGSPPDLKRLLTASDEELRAAGMSRQKSGYIRSLASLVISGELDFDRLPRDDEEAIALLTKIKGIGRWSAEIYLLFAEGRPDVFPAGDLAVMVEIGRLTVTDDDTTGDEVAYDAGATGGGFSAEEGAMHEVPDDELTVQGGPGDPYVRERELGPLIRTGAEQPWDPEDLCVAEGRDPTKANVERARRELAEMGRAAIEKTVP